MKRKGFIGGSDAVKIMNGDWIELWEIKTGRIESPDLSKNLAVQMGILTEDFNISWFEQEYQKGVHGQQYEILLGGTDTTLTGLTDIDLTAGAKTIFDGVGANNLTIGASGTTIVIPGDLQVTGTTTTNNVETVSTSNGVVFEGDVADANELTLIAGTLTTDRTATLVDLTGYVAIFDAIPTTTITATAVELNYVDGVTSSIQTQLNAKVETLSDLSITATATEINLARWHYNTEWVKHW